MTSTDLPPQTIPLRPRVAVFGCTIPTAVVIMLCVVLGSGILPIPLWLLITAAATAAFVLTIPALLLGRRRILLSVLSAAAVTGTLVTTMLIFGHFQNMGFTLAKQYGGAVAASLAATHAATGVWPTDTKELPEHAKPRLNLPWPYVAFCEDGVCQKVAGYFVEYSVDDSGAPKLRVIRRDISARWNWSLKRFE
jgi:hypothetical protein